MAGPGAASFPLGLELVASEARPLAGLARHGQAARLHPGEVFVLDLRWRPTAAVEQPMLVEARLAPHRAAPPSEGRVRPADTLTLPQEAPGEPQAESETSTQTALEFEFPLEYGALPLEALPAGRVYHQSVKLIASRALPLGRCDLQLRLITETSSSPPATIATLEIVPKER
jgi:hypothetical protein